MYQKWRVYGFDGSILSNGGELRPGARKDLTGRELHGRTYDEIPLTLRNSAAAG